MSNYRRIFYLTSSVPVENDGGPDIIVLRFVLRGPLVILEYLYIVTSSDCVLDDLKTV
jgi:hypothetical protein